MCDIEWRHRFSAMQKSPGVIFFSKKSQDVIILY